MQPVPCLVTLKTEAACSSETSVVACTVSQLRRPLNILCSCCWQKMINCVLHCPPPSALLCHQFLSWLVPSLLVSVPSILNLQPVLSISILPNQRYHSVILCSGGCFYAVYFICQFSFFFRIGSLIGDTSSLTERLPLKAVLSVVHLVMYKWLWFLLGLPGLMRLSWVTCGSTLLRPNLKMGNQIFACLMVCYVWYSIMTL